MSQSVEIFMGIEDFIFLFVFILVIIGRVLSWVFKQFVVNQPDTNAEKKTSDKKGIKEYIADWIRTLEDRIGETQWDNTVSQTVENEWERLDTQQYHEDPDIALMKSENQAVTDRPLETRKVNPSTKKRIQKKSPFKKINVEKAMIHYEIFSPPISLRQEKNYVRQ